MPGNVRETEKSRKSPHCSLGNLIDGFFQFPSRLTQNKTRTSPEAKGMSEVLDKTTGAEEKTGGIFGPCVEVWCPAQKRDLGRRLAGTEMWTSAGQWWQTSLGCAELLRTVGSWGEPAAEGTTLQKLGFEFLVQPKEGSGPLICLIWAPDPLKRHGK